MRRPGDCITNKGTQDKITSSPVFSYDLWWVLVHYFDLVFEHFECLPSFVCKDWLNSTLTLSVLVSSCYIVVYLLLRVPLIAPPELRNTYFFLLWPKLESISIDCLCVRAVHPGSLRGRMWSFGGLVSCSRVAQQCSPEHTPCLNQEPSASQPRPQQAERHSLAVFDRWTNIWLSKTTGINNPCILLLTVHQKIEWGTR